MISDDQVSTFRRDGVVHLQSVVGEPLLGEMRSAIDELIARPSKRGGSMTRPGRPGMFFQDRHLFPHNESFARFLGATGLAEVAAIATGSSQTRAFFDHVFVKDPGTEENFVWHQDRPYWPVDGTQICSTWLALTAADAQSSALEFVRGSHRWDTTFRPEYPGLEGLAPEEVEARLWDGVADHMRSFDEVCPAFETEPDRYDVISFAVAPGDVLLFDFRTVHRSGPNAGATRRSAISWRWLGDDAIWAPTGGSDPIVGPDDTVLDVGDPIDDEAVFPTVWPA